MAIGYFVTSLLSVPSSDTSNILLKISKIVDKHRLKLLLLELSKYPIGEASERRLEIVVQSHEENINSYSHQIFECLLNNSALVRLDLSNTGFVATGDTVQALTTMLQVNKTLTHLDLSINWNFSDAGACCVCQGLQHNTSLVDLNLSNTGLVATEDTARALTTMLQDNKTLTHLDLSRNTKFSDLGACCVFEGLQHNNKIVHLNLSSIGLVTTDDISQALTTMLRINKTLTHLDLSMNRTLLYSGTLCICEGLQHNTTLVYLNLSDTGITDKGAEYIAQALESNRSLQTIDISLNQISDKGFACIAKIHTNTTWCL